MCRTPRTDFSFITHPNSLFNTLLLLTLLAMVLAPWQVVWGAVSGASANMQKSVPKNFFFTENKGQWDDRVLYKCEAKNGLTWFLERDGITLLTMKEDRSQPPIVDEFERDLPEMMRKHPARYPMKGHALKFKFVQSSNAKQAPTTASALAQSVEATGELAWHNNYFLGNDSSRWAPDCRNFTSVIYREVWSGIDIEWYESNGQLEFDFVVHPGFDPNQIRMSCEGLEGELSMIDPSQSDAKPNTGGMLRLLTSIGELRTALPSVYQISANGSRCELSAQFQLTAPNTFGIALPEHYDPNQTLRIDPLVFSTYFTRGSTYPEDVTTDGLGNVIIAGGKDNFDFPVTPGVYDPTYNGGGEDGFITKFSANGSQIMFSTYIGGSGGDQCMAIDVDSAGGIVVAMRMTGSFPSTHPGYGPLQYSVYNSAAIRLNSTGSQLLLSVRVSGSSDEYPTSVVPDNNGGLFVAGGTYSIDLPTTIGAFDQTFNDTSASDDGFCYHITSNGELAYCTYLGTKVHDRIDCAVDDGCGGLFLSGPTYSPQFPLTPGAFDTVFEGGETFISHINASGAQMIFSTYFGGAGNDHLVHLTLDENRDILITGSTSSANLPTQPDSYDRTYLNDQPTGFTADGYIAKFNPNFTELLNSTYIGCNTNSSSGFYTIQVDYRNNIVCTGLTSSPTFPTTPNAFDRTVGMTDYTISVLDSDLTQLSYSTFFGGDSIDHNQGAVMVDSNKVALFGDTHSPNFPLTPNAYDPTYQRGSLTVSVLEFSTDTSVSVANSPEKTPTTYVLYPCFPNPFNSTTTIRYSLPNAGNIELKLFDISGREVRTLERDWKPGGQHQYRLDGKELASGTYFVRMQAGKFVKTQKMVLLK